MPRHSRSDIARRRWIGDVVEYAITCRTGSLAERIGRGMDWVYDGVERGDTGIGLVTRRKIAKEWDAVSAEAEQRVREVYAQHGEAYHTGRQCSCAGCYRAERDAACAAGTCGHEPGYALCARNLRSASIDEIDEAMKRAAGEVQRALSEPTTT